MLYLLRDLQDGVIIPHSAEEATMNSAYTVVVLVSLVADFIALYALLRQRDIPLDTCFIISLTVADLLFGGTVFAMGTSNSKSLRGDSFNYLATNAYPCLLY